MQHPQVIDQMQTQHAPRLVEGPESRLIYSKVIVFMLTKLPNLVVI